ncbi:esterase/lipase family protein [Sediminibacillus massiliensis]|uniref:esterase/lipase family protein n=1 Tax=Sediminibacillus massiliensis TaxID=1926277 RepID=UPI0009885056|nr:alpha/beta hydrolase [Sediminibacillus massiliensis]
MYIFINGIPHEADNKESSPIRVKQEKIDSHMFITTNPTLIQKYTVEIESEFLSQNEVELGLEVKEDEIAFAMEKDFYENDLRQAMENFQEEGIIPKNPPFFLFKNKTDMVRLDINAKGNRLTDWIRDKLGDFHEVAVFVAKLLGLKDELLVPQVNMVRLNNGSIDLVEGELDLRPDKKTAVLVHGLCSVVGDNFVELYGLLEAEFNVVAFSYPTVRPAITENASILAEKIAEINDGSEGVIVFAHSMGGIVSRSAIVEEEADISSLIMAGTPNNGSFLAKSMVNQFEDKWFFMAILDEFNPKNWRMADLADLKYESNQGILDLCQESPFIKELNELEQSYHHVNKYFVLAGNKFWGRSDYIVSAANVTSLKAGDSAINLPGMTCAWHHWGYYSDTDYLKTSIKNAFQYLNVPVQSTL